MSTFFGGEQLVEVKTFNRNDTGSALTIYTVPSGRYAQFYIQFIGPSTRPIYYDPAVGVNGVNSVEISNGIKLPTENNGGFIMQAGDSIKTTITGPRLYQFIVKEYLAP